MNDFVTTLEMNDGVAGLQIDGAALASPAKVAAVLRALLDTVHREDVSGAWLSIVPPAGAPAHRSDSPVATARRERYAFAREVQRLLRELETQGKPVVAVIDAPLEGFGVALALACHWRIGPTDEAIAFAPLHEMTPGVTARTVHIAGVLAAADWLVDGHALSGAQALAGGLLDDSAATFAERCVIARRRLAHLGGGERQQRPWDRRGFKVPGGALYAATPTFQKLALLTARAAANEDARRPLRHTLLACIAESSMLGMDAALNAESRRYALLAPHAQSSHFDPTSR